MGTIRIKNLKLRCFIGFKEHEQDKLQDVVLNISMQYDSSRCEKSDLPADTLDYKIITKQIIAALDGKKFNLIEAQARIVMDLIMNHQQVTQACVEIDKPYALRFSESVSFVLEEKR